MGIHDAQQLGDAILSSMMKVQRMISKRQCIRESYHARSLTNGGKWYTTHEWSFYYSDGFTETVTRRDYI